MSRRVALVLLIACAGCTPRATVRPRHPTRHGLRRNRIRRRGRGPGDSRRSDRRPRRLVLCARPPGSRRDRPRGRSRLHQHAQPLGDVADRRRPLAGHDPAGRHARSVRRKLDGAAQRADEDRIRRSVRATSSSTSPGRRSASISITSCSAASRPTSRRSSAPPPSARNEIGYDNRPPTAEELDRMRASRADGDGRGRDGPHHRAHLHSRRVREDRRARRAGEGRVGSRAACTSRTCAAKATGCSRRSTKR